MLGIPGFSWSVFLGFTGVLMGFAAFMTGQGVANTWRSPWQVVFYTLLLGFADRFLVWSLFDGSLLSVSGYLLDTAVLLVIGLVGFRLTQTRRMVTQYPWLYERAGPFSWRTRGEG